MTQNDIGNGRLDCGFAIAPPKPAEFVVFRIEQIARTCLAGERRIVPPSGCCVA